MKKQNQNWYSGILFLITTSLLIFLFSVVNNVSAQNVIAAEIAQMQKQGQFPEARQLFTVSSYEDAKLVKTVRNYTLLEIPGLDQLLQEKPEKLSLIVPYNGGRSQFRILLYRANITSREFRLITSDRGAVNDPQPVIHYRGCIENDNRSVVSFSFSKGETMGMISNSNGDFVLGELTDKEGIFIIYNDKDLTKSNSFECETVEAVPTNNVAARGVTPAVSSVTSKCVKWYWEADYDVYLNKGSVSNANAYMQGIFNQVATLYINDGLAISLKTLYIWTTPDPYAGPGTSDYLNQFANYRTSWDGDLAHLINLSGLGGIAYLNGIAACEVVSTQVSSQKGFSGVNASYNNVPTYSFTVECIAHEQGHQLGSRHTHECVWNGNNTKIDDCGGVAGYPDNNCPSPVPALPAGGGTIMSYCHMTSVGINFANGFGIQPATLIAGKINNSSCLTSCITCPVPDQPSSIAGSTFVCQGASTTYSVNDVTGANYYTWTLPAGWTGSSSTTSITVVPGATGGNLTVTANNACGSSTSQVVSINVLPATLPQPDNITGSAAVCAGSTQTYSVNYVTGATNFVWTWPAGWTGGTGNMSVSAVVGTIGGTISVRAANACGSSAARTMDVSLLAGIPSQPSVISGNASVCPQSAESYSVLNDPGATSYTWTHPTGWTGSSTSNQINIVYNGSGGNLTVKANNACGSSTTRTLSISMLPGKPNTPGTISGATSICEGITQTYSVNTVNNATYYVWTLPNGWTGSSATNSITVTTGATSGTVSVAAGNSCGLSNNKNLSVTIKPAAPLQPGIITGSNAVCSNTQNAYFIAPVANAASYTWALPNGWTGTSTTTSITALSGMIGGNITVYAKNSCGSSPVQTLAVSISGSIPDQPDVINGNAAVCQGSTVTYSVTPVVGAASYAWTLPSGTTGASTGNSIIATIGSTSGNISVRAINLCGSSSTRILPVTVSTSVPARPSGIAGSIFVCPGTVQTYTASTITDAIRYNWTLPAGWSGSSTTNVIPATTGTSGGNVLVSATNVCGTGPAQTVTVTVNAGTPVQPGQISGSSILCNNSTGTYSISPVTGASGYIWSLPAGWSGTSSTNSINVNSGTTGGTISVKATNVCGTGAAQTMAVSLASSVPSIPGSITGSNVICQNSNSAYSVADVPGASSYEWTLPSGWSGSSVSNSINVNSGSSNGTLAVRAVNACGSSADQTLAITLLSSVPGTPGAISGATSICQGIQQTYAVGGITNASYYVWTIPAGWSGSSTSNSINITTGSTSGSVTVAAGNACGTGLPSSLSVLIKPAAPQQPGTISGVGSICGNTQQTYSIAPVANASSYTWSLPAGWTGTSSSATINAGSNATGGTVSVYAKNSCGSSPVTTMAITVIGVTPVQPASIAGNTLVCEGSQITYTASPVAGASSYTWNIPGGWSGTSVTNSITVTAGASGGNIGVKAQNSCGISNETIKSVSINPVPAQPTNLTGTAQVRPGTTEVYSVDPVAGAAYYVWTFPAGWSGSSSTNSITLQTDTASGFVTVTAYNVCGAGQGVSMYINTSSLLPVSLLQFTGQRVNESVVLNWVVTSEINCHGYDIERSADARSFQAIGFTAARGSASSITTYGFTDINPLSGTSYYRLKILDIDGQYSYSNVVRVNFENAGGLNVLVYPNPARDHINIKWIGGAENDRVIRIYNSKGQKVVEKAQIGIGRNSITTLPLKGLSAGQYIMTVSGKGKKAEFSTSFIKVN